MTYEYSCPVHGGFEKFFRSFSEAQKHVNGTKCHCGALAVRVPSLTLSPHFYGNPAGYDKPSPTKRHSTKLVSALTGNKNSSS